MLGEVQYVRELAAGGAYSRGHDLTDASLNTDPDGNTWTGPQEGVRHTGAAWTHFEHARNAILIAYNHVTVRHHEPKPCMNSTVIGGLSESRQGFFRDVWVLGNKR